MRLLFGASLSVVNSTVPAPILLSSSICVLGSTALTMMPLAPAAMRSSIRRFWMAAEDCSGYFSCRV